MADLTQLLRDAATDPALRPDFVRTLLDSQVYVLGFGDRPLDRGKTPPGTHLSLATWANDQGPVHPFFTSEVAMQRALARRPGIDRRFIRLRAQDLFEMVRGKQLILDPDSDYGKLFTAQEVDELLAGRDPGREEVVIPTDTKILVGAAAHIPPELPRVMAEFFAKRPAVKQAHLGWIHYPETGASGYLLVVVSDDREAAMLGFGMLQISDVAEGKNVDALVVPLSQPKHYLSNVPPFYVRKSVVAGLRSLLRGRAN
jgi:hypothetical protein